MKLKQTNYMMVKDDVGRSRPSTWNLPQEENFKYGKKVKNDRRGVYARKNLSIKKYLV